MSYELILLSAAIAEYEEALHWYESQVIGLGLTFEDEIDNCLERICANPEAYSSINKKYRCTIVGTFPYVIIYSIDKRNNSLLIHSIFHTSRQPKKKYRKL